jgi:hypothetical protein
MLLGADDSGLLGLSLWKVSTVLLYAFHGALEASTVGLAEGVSQLSQLVQFSLLACQHRLPSRARPSVELGRCHYISRVPCRHRETWHQRSGWIIDVDHSSIVPRIRSTLLDDPPKYVSFALLFIWDERSRGVFRYVVAQ